MNLTRRITLATSADVLIAGEKLAGFAAFRADALAEQLGFGFEPTTNAPNTYPDLVKAFSKSCQTNAPLHVSSLHSDRTIYPSALANQAYRFWHDACHVSLEADFSLGGEFVVGTTQLAELARFGVSSDSLECELLRIETLSQALCVSRIGRFPKDQLLFAVRCLNFGQSQAIALEHKVAHAA